MKFAIIALTLTILSSALYVCMSIDVNVQTNAGLIEKNSRDVSELSGKLMTVIKAIEAQKKASVMASMRLKSVETDVSIKKKDKIFGIMSVNQDGKIGSCTPGVEQITNLAEEDLVGSSISRFMNNEQWRTHRGYIASFIEKGHSVLSMKREVFMFGKDVELSVHFISTERIFIVHIKEM